MPTKEVQSTSNHQLKSEIDGNLFKKDFAKALNEKERQLAEASGKYIVQYLEKEFQKRERDSETTLKKANRNTMIASLLGAAFGVILTTVVNYFFNQ